ncbi:NADP-dependent fatty aldehyde dehydrogenase domain protein [Leifsonia aquatica ATCC 14665]|uniref:NADP-dependent fatty aldehyde dehydrogenase domain protein n=1 Tax=Leifsonia aquatica ATCC 14665 TaxID=1358026 RepID=U2SZV9_LEIAQ|nr:NADP-dependent fatty aldehyde dehydrogenase domain protein [Leifsonia aquatica ATCC 14665]
MFVPVGGAVEGAAREALRGAPASRQLTPGMTDAFSTGVEAFDALPDVEVVRGPATADGVSAPALVLTDAGTFLAQADTFLAECFGPVSVLVRYRDTELDALVAALEPSLTATIHRAPGEDVSALAAALGCIAGRLLFDGWPTGVAIGWAQHHGGSWPATTASIHTSVGATAIRRWLTPIAYQDAPQEVLPPELRDGNPLGIPRRES